MVEEFWNVQLKVENTKHIFRAKCFSINFIWHCLHAFLTGKPLSSPFTKTFCQKSWIWCQIKLLTMKNLALLIVIYQKLLKLKNSFYFLWYSFHIEIVVSKQNIWFLIVLSAKSKINDSFDHHNFAGRRLVFGQPF